jgi:hypothetical protein
VAAPQLRAISINDCYLLGYPYIAIDDYSLLQKCNVGQDLFFVVVMDIGWPIVTVVSSHMRL